MKDEQIKEKWRYYFGKLLNEDSIKQISIVEVQSGRSQGIIRTIHTSEVEITLLKCKKLRHLGQMKYVLTIEVWKIMGDIRLN